MSKEQLDNQYKSLYETLEKTVSNPESVERIKKVVSLGEAAGVELHIMMLKMVAIRLEEEGVDFIKAGDRQKTSEKFTQLLTCGAIFLSSAAEIIEQQGIVDGDPPESPNHLTTHLLSMLILFLSEGDSLPAARISLSVGAMILRKALEDGRIGEDEVPEIFQELVMAVHRKEDKNGSTPSKVVN